MYGLSGRTDALLYDIYRHFETSDSEYSFAPEEADERQYSLLLKAGLIKGVGEGGKSILKILDITDSGMEHVGKYRQSLLVAGYPLLTVKQDSLLREWYGTGTIKNLDENVNDLAFLAREELIEVFFADDTVYAIRGLTERGRHYCEDRIPECGVNMPSINNSNVVNNYVSSTSSAEANNSISVTFSSVIASIYSSGLEQDQKTKAVEAISEMESSTEKKDQKGFLASVEKIASIAKDVADLASVVTPLIVKAATSLLGA